MGETIKIGESEVHGLGICAKRDIKPGELLIREAPFSYVLCHSEHSPSCCDQCFAEKSELSRCSGCKLVRYCSKKCQKIAWPDHEKECQGIRKAQEKGIFQDYPRLVAKIQLRRKALLADSTPPLSDENGFPNIPDVLTNHNDKWSPEQNEEFESIFSELSQLMTADDIEDKNKMKELFGICQVNVLGMTNGTVPAKIGYGLYLKIAMFNHSCDSNCEVVIDGTMQEVRAIKDIKKGEECFITYVDQYIPTELRHKQLQERWKFTCNCTLCQDKERDARLSGITCGNSKCSSAAPFPPTITLSTTNEAQDDIKCAACSWAADDELKTKCISAIQQMNDNKRLIVDELRNSKKSDWTAIKKLAEKNISLLTPLFHRHNYLIKENYHYAYDASAELSVDDGMKYAIKLSDYYSELVPSEFRSQLGVQYMLAGIECMSIPLNALSILLQRHAEKWLQRALPILDVTHGDKHPLTEKARKHLGDCKNVLGSYESMRGVQQGVDVDGKQVFYA